MKKVQKYIYAFAAAFLVFALSGCGANHGSPVAVIKSLIKAYEKAEMSEIKDCYGLGKKDENADLQAEIDAMQKYIAAHNTTKIKIVDCGIISEDEEHAYIYATYNLVLDDEQEYPCIDTYMVRKSDKKFYILSTADITSEMKEKAVAEYQEFMTSDAYKEYRRAYDTFIKRNPGYEDKIADKLN